MMFLGLSLAAWLVIVIAIAAFIVLIFTRISPSLVFFCIMALLAVLPIMSFTDAFGGFANASVLLVAVLFITIAGMKHSGALDYIVSHVMGQPRTYVGAILRLMIPVSLLSSVMSNTTTTALFKGIVQRWSSRLNLAPSKLLIPLAYAATIGGLFTLIGTPPNLIISTMYTEKSGVVLNLFSPFPVAVCCVVADILLVVLLRRFIPVRTCPQSSDNKPLEVVSTDAMTSQPRWKTYLSLGIIMTMLVVSACNIPAFPMASCALVAGLLMLIFGCCSPRQAMAEVDWNVLIVFAGSVGLGKAIDVTGLDELFVSGLLTLCHGNPMGVMLALALAGGLLTEIISDTACGAMFFPVAWEAATQLGVNPLPFMMVLMMSVSSSFATPIATPPNLLVYIDGGYKFTDYMRLGIPVKIVHIAVAIAATMLFYPL